MKKIIIIVLIIIVLVGCGLLYWNKNKIDNFEFELKGSETILLNIGDTWTDPGYIIEDDSVDVEIDSDVNLGKIGYYEINYTIEIGIMSKTITREVRVLNDIDKTNLSFTLEGDNPYYLMKNYSYEEMGYKVTDKNDGDITSKVTTTNDINNQTEGTYNVTYEISNSDGIHKKVARQVIVYSMKFEGKLRTSEQSQNNDIIIRIDDDNYSYTLLPNEQKDENRNIVYSVTENKLYTFKIYDRKNNYLEYSVTVNNIDNTPPKGSCTFTMNDKNGEITVEASDNVGIKGYEYHYGSNKTNIMESKKYTVNTLDTSTSVVIYDNADNKTTVTCNNIDKSSSTSRSYSVQEFDNRQYWLYVPPGVKTRTKAPLVIYLHGGGSTGNINAVNLFVLPKNIRDGHTFPYYAVAPYTPNRYNLGDMNSYLNKLIDYLVNKYSIDPDRIIISGGSNGSDVAYYVAAKNQKKFAGMIIVAGHNTIEDISQLTYLPVWFHQGSEDAYRYIAGYVSSLNSRGGNARITQYKGGHDAPNNAFLSNDVTQWIMAQKAKK